MKKNETSIKDAINGAIAPTTPTPRKAKRTRLTEADVLRVENRNLAEEIRWLNNELMMTERETIGYITQELWDKQKDTIMALRIAEDGTDAAILAATKNVEVACLYHLLRMFKEVQTNTHLYAQTSTSTSADPKRFAELERLTLLLMDERAGLGQEEDQLREEIERQKDPEAYDAKWAEENDEFGDYDAQKQRDREWAQTEEGQAYYAAKAARTPEEVEREEQEFAAYWDSLGTPTAA